MTVSALSCLVAQKKDNPGSVCACVRVQCELIFSSQGHQAWNRRVHVLCVNLQLSAVYIWPFKEENSERKSSTENQEMDWIETKFHLILLMWTLWENRIRLTEGNVALARLCIVYCQSLCGERYLFTHYGILLPFWGQKSRDVPNSEYIIQDNINNAMGTDISSTRSS